MRNASIAAIAMLLITTATPCSANPLIVLNGLGAITHLLGRHHAHRVDPDTLSTTTRDQQLTRLRNQVRRQERAQRNYRPLKQTRSISPNASSY